MKEINLFGELQEIYEPPTKGKTPTMQEMFGLNEDGKTCKTCKHCEAWCNRNGHRTWYKCAIWLRWFEGHSSASDIRLKNKACKKYEEQENWQ